MAERVSAGLSAASQGRRFGTTVGAAFIGLAALMAWRGSDTLWVVFAGVGVMLVLSGLVIPRALGPIERAWMAFALILSKFTTPVIMGVVYIGVITPIGALRRTFGGHPLVHAELNAGFWRPRPEGARRSKSMRRQF
jgi:hypothetical protein